MKNKTKPNNNNNLFTQNEAAQYLQISPATLRNWIKTNKIKADAYNGKQPCFLRKNIYLLKDRLISGEDFSLKSRRNKTYSTGKTAYTAYLKKDSKNRDFFDYLFKNLENEILSNEDINAIIAQCSLKLYSNKNNNTLNMLLDDLICSYPLPEIISDIFSNDDFKIFYDKDEDLLGLIYSSLRQLKSRKNSGAYYTPLDLAREMNNALFSDVVSNGDRIIDPACGSGSFLITLPEFIPFDNIYGNDIDKTSIIITRINFFLRDNNLSYEQLCSHFTCNDFLQTSNEEKYDYIIGNPPWGSKLDEAYLNSLESKLTVSDKKADSFELFIEKSVKKLSEKGAFGLLIPYSFINVHSHEKTREFLLENGYFKYFNNLKEAFNTVACPGIFVIWSKIKPKNLIISYDNEINVTKPCERIFTKDFMPVFISDSDYRKLNKLINSPNVFFLKNNATFGLGIVTGNNKKLLIHKNDVINNVNRTNNNSDNLLPILKGTDVTRYKISNPEYFIKYDKDNLQQCAPLSLYKSEQKLVYRFINKRLTFALDTNGTLTLNSCNFVIPHTDFLDIKYILAVLNSSTAQFIFKNRFSSVKVLRSHIEQIPIPVIPREKQEQIIYYTDLITCCDNESSFNEYDRIINEMIKDLF